MIVGTNMPSLIVECSRHKFRVLPFVELFGLKERSYGGVIAWQLAYALQVPKWELAIAQCQ